MKTQTKLFIVSI